MMRLPDTTVFDVSASCCVMVKIRAGADGPAPREPIPDEEATPLPLPLPLLGGMAEATGCTTLPVLICWDGATKVA